MSGRGTFAIGNNVDYTYETINKIEGVKVLSGKNGKHGLPEESHSSTAYIKLRPDGTFYEMRIYDENHYLIKEITCQLEPALNNRERKHSMVYIHDYLEKDNFEILPAHLIMKEELQKFFKGMLSMKNGNVQEFVDHICYGDELWFLYNGTKYFLEGWIENDILELVLYEMKENGKDYKWKGDNNNYPVEDFLSDRVFDGKTFWKIENDITWVDC